MKPNQIIEDYLESINEPLFVISLGCGIPFSLFDISIKNKNIGKLIGIDLMLNEDKIIQEAVNRKNARLLYKSQTSIKGCYQIYLFNEAIDLDQLSKISLPLKFDGLFEFKLGQNVVEFDYSPLPSFHLILIENLLHFLKRKESIKILSNVSKKLLPSALIKIEVNNIKNKKSWDNDNMIWKGYHGHNTLNGEDVYFFDEEELEKVVEAVDGFKILSLKSVDENSKIQCVLQKE